MNVITSAGSHTVGSTGFPTTTVCINGSGGAVSVETTTKTCSRPQWLTHKVSLFDGVLPEPVGEESLENILAAIREGQWAEEVAQVRDIYAETLERTGDKKAAKKAAGPLKIRLPSMTASGRFARRNKEGLIEHSGVLVMDMDELDERFDAVRQRVTRDRHTLFAVRSPSGNGLKVGVPIPADPKLRLASFLTAEVYAKEHYDVDIDQACKDPSRLCFLRDLHKSRRGNVESRPHAAGTAEILPPLGSPDPDLAASKGRVASFIRPGFG